MAVVRRDILPLNVQVFHLRYSEGRVRELSGTFSHYGVLHY